jgi:acyl carrier protein
MIELDQNRQEVLDTITAMIREVVGEEWIQDKPVSMETRFAQDLEVESIEIVALAEKMQEVYGETIDFPAWLSNMELEEIINLSVGQLVDFIASCQ